MTRGQFCRRSRLDRQRFNTYYINYIYIILKNNKSTGQKFECHDGPALHPCLYQSHITVEFTSILLPFRCLSAAPLRLALKSASADIPPTSPTRNQGLSLHKDRKLTGNTRNIDSKPNVAPSPRCSLSFLQTYTV